MVWYGMVYVHIGTHKVECMLLDVLKFQQLGNISHAFLIANNVLGNPEGSDRWIGGWWLVVGSWWMGGVVFCALRCNKLIAGASQTALLLTHYAISHSSNISSSNSNISSEKRSNCGNKGTATGSRTTACWHVNNLVLVELEESQLHWQKT